MKGVLLVLLYLFSNVYCSSGDRTSELYRALNITCHGEDKLKKMCDVATPSMVGHNFSY